MWLVAGIQIASYIFIRITLSLHLSLSCGRDYCDGEEIMAIADAMASNGMKELGYQYINLDGELGKRL